MDGIKTGTLIYLTAKKNKMRRTCVCVLPATGLVPVDHGLLRLIASVSNRLPAVDLCRFQKQYMEEKNDTLLVSFLATVTSDTAALQDVRIFLFFRLFVFFFSMTVFFYWMDRSSPSRKWFQIQHQQQRSKDVQGIFIIDTSAVPCIFACHKRNKTKRLEPTIDQTQCELDECRSGCSPVHSHLRVETADKWAIKSMDLRRRMLAWSHYIIPMTLETEPLTKRCSCLHGHNTKRSLLHI